MLYNRYDLDVELDITDPAGWFDSKQKGNRSFDFAPSRLRS
jgi:hypothetical protein